MATGPRTSKAKSRRLNLIRRRLIKRQETKSPEVLSTMGGSSDPERPSGRHPHPSFYILPNLFTSCSLFLSLFSIVKASEGDFTMACWLILGAALCDVIDGPVARLTNTASNFGLQYDSLADIVAFGVAPSFLMFKTLHDISDESTIPSYAPKLALGACALYAICAAIRLARFNVQAATEERKVFKGLPSPGAAGGVVSAYLFIDWLKELLGDRVKTEWLDLNLHRLVLLLMVGLALVMVSEIPFPKLKNLLRVTGNPIKVLVWIVGIFCIIITFQEFLPLLLFAAFMFYTVGSIVVATRQKVKKG